MSRYSPQDPMSSSWVPSPTTRPSSSTMMRSASRMVPTLCATMSLDAPAVSCLSAMRRSLSVLASSAEKESSKM